MPVKIRTPIPPTSSTALDNHSVMESGDKRDELKPPAPVRWMAATVAAATSTCTKGTFRIFAACLVSLAWMSVSSLLILVNKHILKDLNFPFPMTVASMGMAASGCFAFFLCRVLRWADARIEVTLDFYIMRIMPVGLFMALTLWTGNSVYLYLTVSFIQMLKSFTPVITLAMLAMARLETPTRRMVGSILGIASGTALAAYGEVNLSAVGIMLMLVSEATEATKLVMTQLLLVGLRMGPFEGVMYLSPACFFWLMLGCVLLEMPIILSTPGTAAIPWEHAGLFTLAACLGFAVNTLAYATIKLASSLTLKVLGTVKNAFIIFVAVLLYDEVVTPMQGIGYAVSTAAFGVYTAVKMGQIADGTAASGGREPGAASSELLRRASGSLPKGTEGDPGDDDHGNHITNSRAGKHVGGSGAV